MMTIVLGSSLVILFIVAFTVVLLLEDPDFIVQIRALGSGQIRGLLAMIGWYNADKKKGWRLVQDGNDEFNLQKFNFETFTWDTFEHFTNEADALNRYNRMNDIWETARICNENFKESHEAQKKYESNAKKVKKVIK